MKLQIFWLPRDEIMKKLTQNEWIKRSIVKGKNVKSALAKYKKDNPKIEYKNIEATIEEK